MAIVLSLFLSGCDALTGPEGPRYVQVVSGGAESCAQSESGAWYCWGDVRGRRGGGPGTTSEAADWTRPARLEEDPGLDALSAASSAFCGLTDAGRAYCWGRNQLGTLGLGFLGGEYEVPMPVETELRFTRLASAGSSASHLCGLSDGRAYCWGNNFRSQLGAGIEAWEHPFVVPVLGSHTFDMLAVAEAATCGLTPAMDVYCWGALTEGPDLEAPTLVAEDTGFDTLVARHGSRCGLRAGRAFCHGVNQGGQLGTGDTEPHEGFVEVAGGHTFRELSGGRVHVCGVTLDDRAYCWGSGRFGRLGHGSEEDALVPTPVGGGHRFRMLAAGGEHTCGLTLDGEVYCWGYGVWGRLGNGDTEDQWLPVKIADPLDP